ncbi:hypothetical protein D3C76_1569530 [compost metagenome]
MDDKVAATADALELLHMNQQAIRASVEEIALWLRARGSEDTFHNAMVALQAMDTNACAIASVIDRLRN